MNDINIIPLHAQPEFAKTCAAWSFGEWGCHLKGASLDKSIAGYKERATNTDQIPLTWIGLKDEKIIGMISLVNRDHEDMEDCFPWLASMFVHPEFRQKGYATQLIQNLHKESKKLGYDHLYLFTPDSQNLYKRNGWEATGKVRDPRGIREYETLMEIDL